MDPESLKPQLIEAFPGIEEEVLIQCVSMCQMFNLSPEDLRYKWEAFMYNSAVKDQPISFFTASTARDLQKQLQRDLAKVNQTKAQTAKKTVTKTVTRSNVMGANPFAVPSGGRMQTRTGVKAEAPVTSLADYASSSASRPVNFAMPQDVESYRYRYMHEKLFERASILDEQIYNVAARIQQHYALKELGDPSVVSLDEVVVVGRIVNDGDTKLGESSILLESPRMVGSGARVPLEFDANLKIRCASKHGTGSTGIDFFPGMIVALKGKNGSGDRFVVSEVLRLPPLPTTSKSEVKKSLKSFVACGPFTFESDLDYKPLAQIIETVRTERPDLLLLLGPFVDSNHPFIKNGDVDMSPASLFRERISKPLARLEGDMPELVIVLVPSIRDMISSHVVLPQAALERDPELGLSRRCQLVPNPSTFSVNGFTIGATSVDILFHIRKDHFFKQALEIADEPSAESEDSMTMLCRQILEQQSFYPIFPAPREVHEDVNLSVLHLDLLKIKGAAPDILVFPSRLKEFQKIVDASIVINPALASKFNSAGTAACLSITRGPGTETQHSVKLVKLGT